MARRSTRRTYRSTSRSASRGRRSFSTYRRPRSRRRAGYRRSGSSSARTLRIVVQTESPTAAARPDIMQAITKIAGPGPKKAKF